jgi:NADPH-dependent glutamate synthase beta subunit-like oxidoreductase
VKRTIAIKYLVTPVEILGRGEVDGGVDRVAALKIVRNKLTGVAHNQRASPLSPSNEEEDAYAANVVEALPCDLLIKSVGYKCEGLGNSIPFNPQTHTVPQVKGRVVASNLVDWPDNSVPLTGMYVTGWLKRGATGIIASNIPDAKETAAAIGEDLRAGLLKDVDDSLLTSAVNGAPEVAQRTLAHPRLHWMTTPAGEKVMSSNTVVSWADYLKIETEEARRGSLHDPAKVKEKITTIAELLMVAKGNQ